MGASPIANISVAITGDYSDLNNAVTSVVTTAQEAAGQITQAFDVPDAAAPVEESVTSLGAAAETAGQQTQEFGSEVKGASQEAESAESSISGLATSFGELAGISIGVESLREFTLEAVDAYGRSEDLRISLTALSGNAELSDESFEGLKSIALEMAVPFQSLEGTMQRLAPALLSAGLTLPQITSGMEAISAAAKVTGSDVESVGQSVERMSLSNILGARQLATLGITLGELSTQLHVTEGDLTATWKALDASDKFNAIIGAIDHYKDAAQKMATDTAGQVQNLKTEWDLDLEDMGKSLAPVTVQVLQFAEVVGNVIKPIIAAWGGLPSVVKLLELAFPPLAGTVGLANAATAAYDKTVESFGGGTLPAATRSLLAFNVGMEQAQSGATKDATATTATATAHDKAATSTDAHAKAIDGVKQAYIDASSVMVPWGEHLYDEIDDLKNASAAVEKWASLHQAATPAIMSNVTPLNALDDSLNTFKTRIAGIEPPVTDLSSGLHMTTDEIISLLTGVQKISATIPPATADVISWGKAWEAAGQKIDNVFSNDLASAASDAIFQTKNITQAFEKMGEDIVKIILDTIIKEGIAKLVGSLFGVGGLLSSLFGGGQSLGAGLGGLGFGSFGGLSIPMAASGADVLSSGLVFTHAGESIFQPAVVSPGAGSVFGGGTAASSPSATDAPVQFNNCTFHGVTQDLVNDVMNQAIKAARRINAHL